MFNVHLLFFGCSTFDFRCTRSHIDLHYQTFYITSSLVHSLWLLCVIWHCKHIIGGIVLHLIWCIWLLRFSLELPLNWSIIFAWKHCKSNAQSNRKRPFSSHSLLLIYVNATVSEHQKYQKFLSASQQTNEFYLCLMHPTHTAYRIYGTLHTQV